MSVNRNLKETRKKLHKTQNELAQMTFLDQSTISKMENGKLPVVEPIVLRTIELTLGLKDYSLVKQYAKKTEIDQNVEKNLIETVKSILTSIAVNKDEPNYDRYLADREKRKQRHIHVVDYDECKIDDTSFDDVFNREESQQIIIITKDEQELKDCIHCFEKKDFKINLVKLEKEQILSDLDYYINTYALEVSYMKNKMADLLMQEDKYKDKEYEDIIEIIDNKIRNNYYKKKPFITKLRDLICGEPGYQAIESKTRIKTEEESARVCTIIDNSQVGKQDLFFIETFLDILLFDYSNFNHKKTTVYSIGRVHDIYIPDIISVNHMLHSRSNNFHCLFSFSDRSKNLNWRKHLDDFVTYHTINDEDLDDIENILQLISLKQQIKNINQIAQKLDNETIRYYGDDSISIELSNKIKKEIVDEKLRTENEIEKIKMEYSMEIRNYDELTKYLMLCAWLLIMDRMRELIY